MLRALRSVLVTVAACAVASTSVAFAAGYYPTSGWTAVKTLSEPNDVVIALDGEVFVADSSGRRIAVYSSAGSFLREFDGRDGPGTELVRPTSLALGPDAMLYVADRGADRILVFERSGRLVRWWGSRGTANGQFMSPTDLTIDAAGFVYVADTFNNRIQVFSAAGVWQRTIGVGQLSTPAAVVVSGSELYVAETNTQRVTVMSLTGTWLREWGLTTSGSGAGSTTTSRYSRLSGIEVGPPGSILVIDAGRGLIERCSNLGVVSANYGTGSLAQPEGLYLGADGAITVADTLNHRLARFSISSPEPVNTFAPIPAEAPPVTSPKGVAVAADGTSVVVESATGRVRRLDAAGNVIATFATSPSLSSPTGVTVSGDGSEVYVCDTGNSRIVVYSSSGAFLRSIGSPGAAVGQFNRPTAIAENIDGTLVVADTGNNRVQVMYPDGTFLYEVGVGRLRAPTGVATAVDGRIYVSDTGNHRILVFAGDGVYLRSIGGFGSGAVQFNTPAGLAVNQAGDRLLVADRGNHRVQLLSTNGGSLAIFGARGSGSGRMNDPHAAAFLSSTSILVADTGNHRVGRGEWDDTAPVTTASGDVAGWTNKASGAVFSLSASDAHAGIAATYYRLADGPTVMYSGPVTVDTEGETRVTYWSVDRVGNTEAARTFDVRLDRIPPAGSVVFGAASALMRAGVIPVESYVGGADEMRFGRDGSMGAWVPFSQSGSMVVNTEGPTTLQAEYRDLAGNVLSRSFATVIDGTGPVTTIYRVPSSAVSVGAVVVDISATDARSSVARIRYRLDGGVERTYEGPITVSGDGPHSIEAYAVDAVGNVGSTVRSDFGISRLTIGGALSVAGGLEHIGRRTVEVSTTVQSATRMRWDAGSGFSPWVPFLPEWSVTFPGDGFHTLHVQFEDVLGQRIELTRDVHIDLTAPVTSASGVPPSGVSGTPVIIALNVRDDSPVTTRYRIDTGAWREYTVPFTVSGDGNRTVTFQSTDAAGNVEAEKSVSFIIAATPPSGWIRPAGGVARLATQTVDLEIDAPGAVRMRFDTGGGPQAWMPFARSARVTVPGEGLHWITATFANIAGVESQASAQVLVDLTPPVTAVGGAPIGVSPGPVNLTINAYDALSRVTSISYRVDGGSVQTYRGPFTVSGDGVHRIEHWATDEVGNTSPHATEQVSISSLLRGGSLVVAGGAARIATLTASVEVGATDAREMRVDTGNGFSAWRPFERTFSVTLAREGMNSVRVELRNELGVDALLSTSVLVDMTPPVTSVIGLPAGGASSGPVMIALTTFDVSPVVQTVYSLDGGAWRQYAGPFVVSGAGVHSLAFRSRDSLGNQEQARTVSFLIASNLSGGSLRPAGGRSIVNTTTVSIEASVAGAVQMAFDGGRGFGPWSAYARSARVDVPGEGLHWIVGAFRDSRGVETTLGAPVLVDLTTPVSRGATATLATLAYGRDRAPRYALSLRGVATDQGSPASGISSWRWRLGQRTVTNGVFTGLRAGRYSVTATVLDRAGNATSSVVAARLGVAAAPVVPSRAQRMRAFSVRVTVPWAGSGAVGRIHAYKRAADGSWRLAKSVTPTLRVSGQTASMTAKVALPAGQWRLVAATSRSGSLITSVPSAVIAVR